MNVNMASCSRDVFVPGRDDDKMLKYYDECDVDVNSLTSDTDSENSASDTGVKRRRVELNASDDDNDDYDSDSSVDNRDMEEGTNNDDFEEIFPHNPDIVTELPFPFSELPGPKHAPLPNSPPISYFNLFFTSSLLSLIVAETNRYADQFLSTRVPSSGSRNKMWQRTTIDEIRAFIIVIVNMGIIRKPTIESYWSKTEHFSTPWFGKMFSRNRFQLLLKFFHLIDNSKLSPPGSSDYDPSARFQPLLDHANRIFRQHYIPHQQLSIDESLVGTKCHTQLLQYMPNKHHHKWGIKFWMICDSISRYCLGFFVYKGAKSLEEKTAIKSNGLAYTVVMKLLQLGNYLNKGYHIYIDNFFTSIPLAKHLYSLGTYVTGTIRKNRKGIPEALKTKFKTISNRYFRLGSLLLIGSKQKKSQKNQVILLTTNGTATESPVKPSPRNNNQQLNKPDVISAYNSYMGGIDSNDMMLYFYLDERRTVKYWKKVACNIISRMMLNAYILYGENITTKKMTRFQFYSAIIETVSTDWFLKRKGMGKDLINNSPSTSYGVKLLPKKQERQCAVCYTPGLRKRSRTVCVKCEKGLHPKCIDLHKCTK